MGFRWFPVALASKYLNLKFYHFVFCYLFSVSCHFSPHLIYVPRCGSIIVDLALKFNSTTKEQDVMLTLNDAVKDGKLGEFSVGVMKGKRRDVEPTSGGATSPLDGSYGGKSS